MSSQHTWRDEGLRLLPRHLLAGPVAVLHPPLPAPDRVGAQHRVNEEQERQPRGVKSAGGGPAHGAAAKHVGDERDEAEPGRDPDSGDARDPRSMRSLGLEAPPDDVWAGSRLTCRPRSGAADGRAWRLAGGRETPCASSFQGREAAGAGFWWQGELPPSRRQGVVECFGEAPRVPPVHPALAAPPRPRLHGCPKPPGRDDLGLLAADRALGRISVRTAAHRARLVRRHGNGERVRVRHGRHAGCRGRRGASGPPGHGWHRRARGRVPVRAHECALQASRRQSCRAERGVDTTHHDHAGGHVDNGPDAVEATQDFTWMRSATSSWCAAELGACVRRHPVWCVADPRDAWPRACGHT